VSFESPKRTGEPCKRTVFGDVKFCFQHRQGWAKHGAYLDKGRVGVLTSLVSIALTVWFQLAPSPNVAKTTGIPDAPTNVTARVVQETLPPVKDLVATTTTHAKPKHGTPAKLLAVGPPAPHLCPARLTNF
jgi:hypothetical protein